MLSVINYYYHYTTSDMTIARGFIHSHTFVKCQTCCLLIVFFFPQRLIKCLHTRERSCHACSHCIANKYSCVKDEKFNNNICLITSLYSLLFFLLIFSKKRKKKNTDITSRKTFILCFVTFSMFVFLWPLLLFVTILMTRWYEKYTRFGYKSLSGAYN